MHILVVNDDGPPSPHASPYVHSLVRALQAAGHLVSVCLPHTQRSWIGKAHMIGQTVEPTYYRPPPADGPPAGMQREAGEPDNAGTHHARPFSSSASSSSSAPSPPEEWVLVNGTPASCVQIGLYHVFRARPPVDLVLSGPNYGRNTTAVFALSSGTLGGALEAATCGKRAVALSYAFFRNTQRDAHNHDRAIVAEASRHAVRVVEALVRQWPADGSVDLYSVNVPLVAGVSQHKTVYAAILQNYWREGGCFTAVDSADHADGGDSGDGGDGAGSAASEEEAIRSGLEAAPPPTSPHGHTAPITHQHFKWQPQFADVYRSVDEAPPGNDGWAVREGLTSITPLKANFWQAATELHQTEFKLDPPAASLPPSGDKLYALVAYEDAYVQPILLAALQALVPADRLRLLSVPPPADDDDGEEPISLAALVDQARAEEAGAAPRHPRILQITPYEAIDFAYAAEHAASVVINSYMIRKALIRKHFLADTVAQWVAKRPQSVLAAHVPRQTEFFEVDYAEFLDDALVEAFDLRASLDANAGRARRDRQWWILKPSMSDRGQGIRLFSTLDELQAIFDGWEADMDADGDGEGGGEVDADHDDAVAAADLRHFVAQPYLHPPLLLPGTGGRKFHVRAYVLCVGALQVYVHRDMLALFAAQPYRAPWAGEGGEGGEDGEDGEDGVLDLAAHLTNTCLQDAADKGDAVRRFWDLDDGCGGGALERLFAQIGAVTGALFEAAALAAPVHFQPLPGAFEVFGLDFLVTAPGSSGPAADATAWLLEVNAFPDFRQTGSGLQAVVVQFWTDVLRVVVPRQLGGVEERGRLVLVKDVALGRR